MRHIIDRAYAPHRTPSFDLVQRRQASEAARGVIRAAFYFLLLGVMMLSGWLG
ncbi:MAG: hypothetical protein LUC93_03635 [Planctomycetaceae bacterium]|nr:hypothetical protein [Planctomycetaceae bacterium]